jgi:hypothetical protein
MQHVINIRRFVGGVLVATAVAVLPAAAQPTAASAAVVPNQFVRDCSNVTRRCTGYVQTNGRYDGRYPSAYTTRWVWRWI